MDWSPERLLEAYRQRWRTERFHRVLIYHRLAVQHGQTHDKGLARKTIEQYWGRGEGRGYH